MFDFNDEKSVIYNKGYTTILLLVMISIILTWIYDDTSYEPVFRGLWILSISLCGILVGTKEVFLKKNKAGYLYYLGISIFLLVILYIGFIMN